MSEEDRTRVVQALNVMNSAIDAHRDDFPYKQILELSEKLLGDETIGMAVYADDASAPFDHYTVRFADGRFELLGQGKKGEPRITWKVSRDYLGDVVRDADTYIAHPEKLDLDWLKSRLSLD